MGLDSGTRLGPYEIVAQLGAGGMGEVYRARDSRLGRDVAIKVLSGDVAGGSDTRLRFHREAQLLAAVTHPNVCQIFDLGEHQGMPYLAMELLTGESLATRLTRGALEVDHAVQVTSDMLAALAELHQRGIVHRDLKPSNVFLTPHGVKLLDFGIARQVAADSAALRLTRTGSAFGTPGYMAPEQWSGTATPASDLFSCGALLYEMLTGELAFSGATPLEILQRTLSGRIDPLAERLGGLESLIRRAVAPQPEDRYQNAGEMLSALGLATASSESPTLTWMPSRPAGPAAPKRLLVLPFRLLRPDPEIEFLCAALADAVIGSLGGMTHLVVLSSRHLRAPQDDLVEAARQAGADAVLYGTLLRSGERVRVSTQLVEARDGTIAASSTAEATLRDLFDLQDELARQVVAALRVPLTPRDERQLAQKPPDARAYELYLRAVGAAQSATRTTSLAEARDLLRQSVERDAGYAPAWAQLGRVHRLLAKYGHADRTVNVDAARRAFETALALDPAAPLVHNLYTHFEIEELASPVPAMLRLLGQIETHPADAALYAGLVTACRYTGLLEASLAAHRRARELDPEIRTGVHYTYWMMGDWAHAVELDDESLAFARLYALPMLGRADEAIRGYESWRSQLRTGLEVDLAAAMIAALTGDRAQCLESANRMLGSGFRDAEGLYFLARCLAYIGGAEQALGLLERVIGQGFTCPSILAADPWLDSLRDDGRFAALVESAKGSRDHAQTLFLRAHGAQRLGLTNELTRALRDG